MFIELMVKLSDGVKQPGKLPNSTLAQRCKGGGVNSLKWEMTEEWKWLVNAINNQRQNRTRSYF